MVRILFFVLMVVTSMQVHAVRDPQTIFEAFNAKSRVLDKSLPTEEQCTIVEQVTGTMPAILKQFYLTCGNHVLHGYEMGFVYQGVNSSLAALHSMAKEDDWAIPDSYFPFCRDQDLMYCLNKEDGTIVVFERFKKSVIDEQEYKWDSFLIWLESVI